jgi:hypothetical protein
MVVGSTEARWISCACVISSSVQFYHSLFFFFFRRMTRVVCGIHSFRLCFYTPFHLWPLTHITDGILLFHLSTAFRPALVSIQPPIQWVPGSLSRGVKQPGREADHSPPSSTEVKRMHGTIPALPHYAFIIHTYSRREQDTLSSNRWFYAVWYFSQQRIWICNIKFVSTVCEHQDQWARAMKVAKNLFGKYVYSIGLYTFSLVLIIISDMEPELAAFPSSPYSYVWCNGI